MKLVEFAPAGIIVIGTALAMTYLDLWARLQPVGSALFVIGLLIFWGAGAGMTWRDGE